MRRMIVVVSLFAILVLTACEKKKETNSESIPPQSGSFKMALTTNPAPPVESQNTTFRLNLTDTSGKPVTGAEVKTELKMPSMDMGKNEFALADKGSGDYEGIGKFTMAGPWDVIVTAKQGNNVAQQTFHIVAHRR